MRGDTETKALSTAGAAPCFKPNLRDPRTLESSALVFTGNESDTKCAACVVESVGIYFGCMPVVAAGWRRTSFEEHTVAVPFDDERLEP